MRTLPKLALCCSFVEDLATLYGAGVGPAWAKGRVHYQDADADIIPGGSALGLDASTTQE
jgi:hypothetical protein